MILFSKIFSRSIKIILFCLLLSSCGGGGGGSASPIADQSNSTLNSAKFKTAEYNSQLAFEKSNVADDYAYFESIGKLAMLKEMGLGMASRSP